MKRALLVLIGGVLALAALTGASAAPVPDDPADPVRRAEYWLDSSDVRSAWQTTRGAGVTVAIIDTGIGHAPQLDPAVSGGTDVSGVGSADGRTPVGAVDANHGSWVASLVAAQGAADGTGMIGVAPDAKLLSISVGFGSTSQAAARRGWGRRRRSRAC